MLKCLICDKEIKSLASLPCHTKKIHNLTSQQYYDKFFKKQNEDMCRNCGNQTQFLDMRRGYREFCSCKCAGTFTDTLEKRKQTCKQKYGTEFVAQVQEVKQKSRQTCLEKYGVEFGLQNDEVKERLRKTNLEKYGVDNQFKRQDFQDIVKKISLEKYGVDHPAKSSEVKEKIKFNNFKKYGVVHPSKTAKVQERKQKTCIEKYNIKCTLMQKEKIKNTWLERYGVDNPNQVFKIKEKKRKTFLKNYGVDNPFKSSIIRNQIQEIIFKKYGVICISQSEDIKQKIKQTRLKFHLPKVQNLLKKLNLKLISGYVKAHDFVEFQCLTCDTIFETCYFHLQQGFGKCPNCYPKYKSIAETEILNYIKSLDIKTLENSKKIINPLELDVYVPEKQIAIEYNGLYWHSEAASKDKNYHLNKLQLCQEKNITLIQIFEDEWVLHQDIVKHRLKQILNVNNSRRIHARSCIIKSIPSKVKNEFLNAYHLQGIDNSPLSLGAFYKDPFFDDEESLVAVMTFSHGSLAKGVKKKDESIWELNRYCCDYNYHIPGIASKLLSYFKKNYEWKSIYSYADRRWSKGNMYYKLGFSLDSITKPNYWYVKGLKRIHRFALRKKPDEPKDIPEWLLRMQEGYTRVWDCGNLKFIKKS